MKYFNAVAPFMMNLGLSKGGPGMTEMPPGSGPQMPPGAAQTPPGAAPNYAAVQTSAPDQAALEAARKQELGNKLLALSGAVGGMSMRPNQGVMGLAQMGQKGLQDMAAEKKALGQANKTADWFEQQGRSDLAQLIRNNPGSATDVYKAYVKSMFDAQTGAGTPAELQTFNEMTKGMTPEEIERAKRINLGLDPRAAQSLSIPLDRYGDIAFNQQAGKSQAELQYSPEIASRVEAAKQSVQQTFDQIGEQRSNTTAYNVYNAGIKNLEQALAGTTTGRVAGLIPAITSSQQVADGAIAVMAPILKQMFRSAGEGVFTDKDQELLMKMIPTRGTNKEAVAAQLQIIDMVVQSKLKMDQPQVTAPGTQTPAQGGFTIKGVR